MGQIRLSEAESSTKYEALQLALQSLGKIAVAFSGGVDSTLLAYAAFQAVGNNAVAALAVMEMLPRHELARARELAAEIGIPLLEVPVDVLSNVQVRENGPRRCYHCKRLLFSKLLKAIGDGFILVEGSNVDDLGDYRPGRDAILELGVKSPLLDARLSKMEIRALSKQFGLKTHALPSMACLASRVECGMALSVEILRGVEAAEEFLHEHGFWNVRVRAFQNGTASVELPPEEIDRFMEGAFYRETQKKIAQLGFARVVLDLAGYRTGSMNPQENSL